MNIRRRNAILCFVLSAGMTGLCVALTDSAFTLPAAFAAGLSAAALVYFLIPAAPPIGDISLVEAMTANAQLRHDLRGALSPALLVSDRLTSHADPAVAKAGSTVVRAVQRAIELLESNKAADAARSTTPHDAA